MKKVEAVGVTSLDEALAILLAGEADAIALGRESLQSHPPKVPGARILEGAFHSAGTAIGVRKNKPAALAYVTDFIEAAKADGAVRHAFNDHGMAGRRRRPAGSRS